MAQTIKLKRSSTGGAVPSTSSLSLGEVAINTYDGKMYIKKNDGSDAIVEIGAGTSAVWKSYDYTATSSQTSFSGNDDNSESLSYVAGFVQVFLNGILLDPAVDYAATTGSSIVLTSGATTGDLLQIESFTQIIGTGDILVDTFPVSSTQTAFTLSQDPINKNNISVYVEGVYQESSTYSLSTTTLTLSESPANGTTVEVVIGTRNVTLDGIVDLTISGTLHAGALDLGDANIINVNEISLDTIKGDADANTNITFAGSDVTTFTQGGTERLRLNTTGAEVTGNIVVSGTVDGRDVAADGATADAALSRAGGAMGGAITTNSTFDGRDVSVDGTKLDTIEVSATADQTDVEIRAAVESASDSNVFTNADHNKLDAIEASADVTDATNVTAAGALMDSELTSIASVKALNQGVATNDMVTFRQSELTVHNVARGNGYYVQMQAPYGEEAFNLNVGGNKLITTLGYNSATSLLLHTANTERLRINSAGNVGIGTTSPLAPLDVVRGGTTGLTSVNGRTALLVQNNLSGGTVLSINAKNTGYSGIFLGDQDAEAVCQIQYNHVDNKLKFLTNGGGSNPLTLSGQNVGIGTSSPAAKLHIQGAGTYNHTPGQNTTSDFVITSSEMADNNAHSIMQLVSVRQSLSTGSGATGYLGFSTVDDSNGQGIRDAGRIAIVNEVGSSRNSATALSFWTNAGGTDTTAATEKMRIDSSGQTTITSTAAIPLKVAYNSTNYMAIGHEFTNVVSGGVGHIFKVNNTQKMLLSASGLAVTGSIRPTSHLYLPDTAAAVFGTGEDLEIYHDASDSYIKESGTGNLLIQGSDIYMGNTSSNHAFVIRNSGNVGIGFAGPSNPLSVNGVITVGNFTAANVNGTPADANTAEVGPGYINLARDDTAVARQITFGKNGAVHSYLETSSTALEIGAAAGLRTRILGNGNTVFQAGADRLFSIGSGTYEQGKIRQYVYQATVANGATVDLFGNTSAHTDIHYYMTIEAFHSGRTYKTSNGSIGGYGWYHTTVGTGINPASATVATGRQKLRWTNTSGFAAAVYISALIFGNNSVDVYNGAISEAV